MMESLKRDPNRQYNSLIYNAEQSISVNPESKNTGTGKSVKYVQCIGTRYWFPIRATYHRAKNIYEKLLALGNDRIELYLPTLCHVEHNDKNPSKPIIIEEPLDKSLLFMFSSYEDFRDLLQSPLQNQGMTPFYNHFRTNEFGKNEYLTIPDRQMESFRIIVESRNEDIIIKQTEIPKIIEGNRVLVTDGPFAGVEGIVMKYRHQKRVFVELQGVGCYATAYVPGAWLRKVDS